LGYVLAPSSLKVYSRAWVLYKEFSIASNIKFNGVHDLPIKVSHVALFISYLHLRGFASTTIITYTTALGYAHKVFMLYDPINSTLVQKLLASVCRISPSSDNRLPITKILLLNLVMSVNQMSIPYYHKLLIKTMFIVAFFGLMRIGEITITTNDKDSLQLNQITFMQRHVKIIIKHFKHNKNALPRDLLLPKQEQKQICPDQLLTNYLKLRGLKAGALFCFPGGKSVTRNYFTEKLKTGLLFCGLDVNRYKTHSFRIGGASYYASLGMSDTQIRFMGRWESDAFKKYMRSTIMQTIV
jgi:hypothetical protein